MKTLDRYVAREFLRLLLVITLSVVALYIIINFFEQIDKMVGQKPGFIYIIKYYAYQAPYLTVLLLPVAMLLATFFSLGEFAMRNELLAMKAAGVNVIRSFFPILGIGAVITGLVLWANMGLVPQSMQKAREIKAVKILKRSSARMKTQGENLAFFGTNRRMFFLRRVDARRNVASGVVVLQTDSTGRVVQRIDAVRGDYIDGHWRFSNTTQRNFKQEDVITQYYPTKDYPEITESPFDFLKSHKELQNLSVKELNQRISILRAAGMEFYSEMVELNVRYSFPFMNFIILLFALPLAASMRGVSRAWGFGITIMVAFFYWAFLQASRTLGDTGQMNPIVAAWLPNAVFLVMSLPGFFRIKR